MGAGWERRLMPSRTPAAPQPPALREIAGTPTPLPSPGRAVLWPDECDLTGEERDVEVERGEPERDAQDGGAVEEAAGCRQGGLEEGAAEGERGCDRELVCGGIAYHAHEPRDQQDERENDGTVVEHRGREVGDEEAERGRDERRGWRGTFVRREDRMARHEEERAQAEGERDPHRLPRDAGTRLPEDVGGDVNPVEECTDDGARHEQRGRALDRPNGRHRRGAGRRSRVLPGGNATATGTPSACAIAS